ncbi:hypothetical protein [Marinospirillum sp.]|uniref:hypothetical protein n=1 Tax=Marinospirillum sp. TaxID=2183934 RepID=UPI00286FE79E|nr:hypothetical protein [Marinospirillum sp.]MDR9468580.1 hypothetical protein [Marinospirillum sp.]
MKLLIEQFVKRKAAPRRDELVIRLAVTADDDQLWWLPVASAPRQISWPEVAELSYKRPAQVLLDARGLRLDWLQLPPGVKPGEAELLLEDQLCQPLDEVEVLPLQKKGRQLLTATLDHRQAEAWQTRVESQGVRVDRWIPEDLAFAQASPEDDLVLVENGWVWHYQADEQKLLLLPEAVHQASGLLEGSLPLETEQLPQKALVPFMAEHLPPQVNLWPSSSLQALLRPLRRIKQLRTSFALIFPWLLVVVFLAGHLSFQQLASADSPARQEQLAQLARELLGEEVPLRNLRQQAQRRLELLQEHRQWQQQRLDAWSELQQVLRRLDHLELQALSLGEQGLTAQIEGVEEADQARLRQLDGRWTFTDKQARWENSL